MKKVTKVILGAGVVAGAAALGVAIQKKRIAPVSYLKQMKNAMKLTVDVSEPYGNGQALTPPMGWSSWNTLRNRIDENVLYDMAAAMKKTGLVDAGYVYLNIDDCWMSSSRDENGRLQADFATFPNGITALREKVNALGMKLGIYTSNGTLTCEDMPASLGYESIDADTFAQWGIEYFKYDFCHNIPIARLAPCIEKITLTPLNGGVEIVKYASDASLTGEAHLVEDMKLESGEYVAGMSNNAGAAEFSIDAPEAGEYVLTLCLRKRSNTPKHLEVLVNGADNYKTDIPKTLAVTANGRHQLKLQLQEGTNSIKLYNPIASRQDSAAVQYRAMGDELKRAAREYAEKTGEPEKPITFSICEWGMNQPWKWGRYAGNLWRTTPDIQAFWASVVGIYEVNVRLAKFAQPGAWNDPDMLEVGNGSLTEEQNRSHFSLWCMMAAPLILGNDIRKLLLADGTPNTDSKTLQIISNKELIAIDQDPLGKQCRRIHSNVLQDILIKPLAGGEFALCFFNKTGDAKLFSQDIAELIAQPDIDTVFASEYSAKDLWTEDTFVVKDVITADVPAYGVKVYRISAQ
ncbi:MAG: alpha-galactosidase [Oscillospiraceae bacterium]|nr:alpha-galactosidase [Oscillospiraceae bacterium]